MKISPLTCLSLTMKFAKNPTSILPSCSSWQRQTSRPIFDCAMTCGVVSPKDWERCSQAVFTQVGREECSVLSCCYSAQIVFLSSRWCFVVLLDVSITRTKVPMGSSFLAFSLADPQPACSDSQSGCRGCGERMSLLVVAWGCAPSMLTKIALNQGQCWEESLLVAMEVTWESQGGLRRRLPSPRGLLTHSLSSGDAHPESVLAEAKRTARAWGGIYLCSLGHQKVVPCSVSVCFLLLVLAAKKAVCEWVHEVCVRVAVHVHVSCVTISTVYKKTTDQQCGGTSSIFQMHTCFDGHLGHTGSQNSLSMSHQGQPCPSTYTPTHCASTHVKPVAPSSPQQRHRLQDSMDFLLSLSKGRSNNTYTNDNVPLVTRLAQPLLWLRWAPRPLQGASWVTTFALIHRRLGLTASPSSISCSKWQGCVRLSSLESLQAIHPTQTFSGDCEGKLPSPHAYGERLHRSLHFRSLGLTTSQVIAQSNRPWRRALSWRAGREDRSRVFCKPNRGERQADGEIFSLGCICPWTHTWA